MQKAGVSTRIENRGHCSEEELHLEEGEDREADEGLGGSEFVALQAGESREGAERREGRDRHEDQHQDDVPAGAVEGNRDTQQ